MPITFKEANEFLEWKAPTLEAESIVIPKVERETWISKANKWEEDYKREQEETIDIATRYRGNTSGWYEPTNFDTAQEILQKELAGRDNEIYIINKNNIDLRERIQDLINSYEEKLENARKGKDEDWRNVGQSERQDFVKLFNRYKEQGRTSLVQDRFSNWNDVRSWIEENYLKNWKNLLDSIERYKNYYERQLKINIDSIKV